MHVLPDEGTYRRDAQGSPMTKPAKKEHPDVPEVKDADSPPQDPPKIDSKPRKDQF